MESIDPNYGIVEAGIGILCLAYRRILEVAHSTSCNNVTDKEKSRTADRCTHKCMNDAEIKAKQLKKNTVRTSRKQHAEAQAFRRDILFLKERPSCSAAGDNKYTFSSSG